MSNQIMYWPASMCSTIDKIKNDSAPPAASAGRRLPGLSSASRRQSSAGRNIRSKFGGRRKSTRVAFSVQVTPESQPATAIVVEDEDYLPKRHSHCQESCHLKAERRASRRRPAMPQPPASATAASQRSLPCRALLAGTSSARAPPPAYRQPLTPKPSFQPRAARVCRRLRRCVFFLPRLLLPAQQPSRPRPPAGRRLRRHH